MKIVSFSLQQLTPSDHVPKFWRRSRLPTQTTDVLWILKVLEDSGGKEELNSHWPETEVWHHMVFLSSLMQLSVQIVHPPDFLVAAHLLAYLVLS